MPNTFDIVNSSDDSENETKIQTQPDDVDMKAIANSFPDEPCKSKLKTLKEKKEEIRRRQNPYFIDCELAVDSKLHSQQLEYGYITDEATLQKQCQRNKKNHIDACRKDKSASSSEELFNEEDDNSVDRAATSVCLCSTLIQDQLDVPYGQQSGAVSSAHSKGEIPANISNACAEKSEPNFGIIFNELAKMNNSDMPELRAMLQKMQQNAAACSGSTEISHNTRQQENQQSSFQDASHTSDCVENVKNPMVEILHPESCIESYVTSEHSLHTILSDLDILESISSKPITGIMNQDTILMNTAHQILLPRAIQPIQLQPNIQQHLNMSRFVLNDTEGNPVLITLLSDTKFVTLPGPLEKNNLVVSPVQPEKEVKVAVDNPVLQNDVAVPKTEIPVMNNCPENNTHMKGTVMNENE